MKVLVASAHEASSQKAHAINTVKIAEGFSRLGHEVHLLCMAPKQGPVPSAALNERYGITSPLIWHQIPDRILGFKITPHWTFFAMALPLILQLKPDLVYSRNYILPAMCSRLGIPTIGETHAWPDNQTHAFKIFLKATHQQAFLRCVTISQQLAGHYEKMGAAKEKLLVLPDAVDLRMFIRPGALDQSVSPYQNHKPNVAYAGHLYDYKGIPTILEAAGLLPDVQFHLIGGLSVDIERHQQTICEKNIQNVILHGMKPYSEVPPYLWHADLLLLPPSAHHPSASWTSPVKLGEYLASGTPTLATRIQALTDWLSEEEACFVFPDDAKAMADGIQHVLNDAAFAKLLIMNGQRKAHQLTYEGRVSQMLNSSWEMAS